MRGRSLRIACIGAAIAIVAIVAPTARLGAANAATCTRTSGVTVIVDFTHFHGAVERGCAPGSPSTALAAMRAAGFSTAGTTRYGDAFLCRIDAQPSPQAEACTDTPPAKSSWSFYRARPTDTSWTYADVGVLSYRPPPGTIIAFAFGNVAKPGVLPPAAIRAQATVSTTTTSPPPPSIAPMTAPTVAPAPTTPVVAAAATTTTMSPSTSVATTTTRPVPASTTTSTPAVTKGAAARIVDRTPIGDVQVQPDSGSSAGVFVAAALVFVLGIAAALAIRARRRHAT